jgi:hypothetical protein
MAQVDWYIEGVEFSNCNCDYACPCQFESRRPTYGDCRGFAAVLIDKGSVRHSCNLFHAQARGHKMTIKTSN